MDDILRRQSVTKSAACEHIMYCCSKCKGVVSYCRCLIRNGKGHTKKYDTDSSKCRECTPQEGDWLSRTIAKRKAQEEKDRDGHKQSGLGSPHRAEEEDEVKAAALSEETSAGSSRTGLPEVRPQDTAGRFHPDRTVHKSSFEGSSSGHGVAKAGAHITDTSGSGLVPADQLSTKCSKFDPVRVFDSCKKCSNPVAMFTSDVHGSDHVNCSSCNERNYVLVSDEDKKRIISTAADLTDTKASQEQRHAGNYQKGKFKLGDLTIAIENPKGSVRRGTSKSGHKWETELKDHYGYILKHVSEADGDHMDVFIAAEPDFTNRHVYVVDQYIGDQFDEHKVLLLASNAKEAKKIYDRNYQSSWKGFKNLSTLSLAEFKTWLKEGDTGKPLFVKVPEADEQAVKVALATASKLAEEKDKGGDESGGYGDAILCKRQGKCYLLVGDWWSTAIIDIYEKELRKALPQYQVVVEAESMPNGYEEDNMGDWAKIKHG